MKSKLSTVRFGKNLKDILDCLEITQDDLAKRGQLTPACISQIVNGQRDPTLITVVKILNVLGCTLERMLK